jgi:acetylornithine deacetylase
MTPDHPALDALAALVRTPSVNPTLAPSEGTGEAGVAAVAADWLRARGLDCRLEEVAPGRPNLIAETGDGSGRTLVLCAHLDTVATAGMTIPPFEPRLEDGRLYGRGSYDMKGGAAAAMAAAAALAAEGVHGRLVVALVADEECASLGAQHFVRHHRADACILTEPSEGRLILGHKGFLWVEVETAGRAAHGSRFDLGVSAIAEMAPVVVALERFDREVLRRRVDPLLGPASQHCATIEGGSGLSTYAERCRLRVERRTLPEETPEGVLEELRAVVGAACPAARVRPLLDRPPLAGSPGSAIAGCVRAAATAVTGRPPEEAGVAYWMDAALFAAAGIPTVDYGPSGAGAHEAVEWVDAASVVTCAAVLAEAARRFLAPPPAAYDPPA